MNNLIKMFPDATKREKRKPVDYGPDHKGTTWKIIKTIVGALIAVVVGVPLLIILTQYLKDFDFNNW